ncbi:MAG: exodeoxyribonuclease III [Ignavibacteria bacterium]|jgi:exodeoxyribonuclease-3|nr:exodeoxyribonuclease III [Chlorobiota bacterium]
MIKIISWNVNGIRASLKKGLTDYVLREQPQIFCVQETKAEREQVPTDSWPPPGYRDFYHSCSVRGGYSGVATFTTLEPLHVNRDIGIERFDQEGRVMQTDFEQFTLLNVYFPNGGARDERLLYKLDFYDAFFEYCEELRKQGKKLIICGDYNTAHHPIDLARPNENKKTSGFMDVERVKLDQIQQLGYVDTFRLFNQEPGQYTWWDVKTRSRERNIGWRIDYHWVTEDLVPYVKHAYHQADQQGSDHCPVVLELSF